MRLRSHHAALLIVGAVLASGLSACLVMPSDEQEPDEPQRRLLEHDIDTYNRLQEELDRHRTEFAGKKVDELGAWQNSLFWLEFPSYSPTVHRYDAATGKQTNFLFGIGSARYNMRASERFIVTADERTGLLTAYDATKPNVKLGELELPSTLGEAWCPYAVDNDAVYVVTSETPNETKLYRWEPGAEPSLVTTLEDAGATIGMFLGFGVEAGRMVFIESGRLWTMDLAAKKASWISTKFQVGEHVYSTSNSVLFTETSSPVDLVYVSLEDGTRLSVRDAVRDSSYAMNDTYREAHHWTGAGFTRWRSWVIYIGQSGVFGFDMLTHEVVPILLEPRSGEIRYMDPVALTGGQLFVTGLPGSDGPIYSVDLTSVLR